MLDKPPKAIDPALLARFAAIVGEKYAISDRQAQAPYLVEMRDMFQGRTPMVLRPACVAEVSQILQLANETATPLVPQGGNTGLVGGQIPLNDEIVLSLTRLDRIREVDPTSNTITCEAGVTLAACPRSRRRRRSALSAIAAVGGHLHHRRQSLPPTPAAPRRSPTASRARTRSASRWCSPTAASSTTSTS